MKKSLLLFIITGVIIIGVPEVNFAQSPNLGTVNNVVLYTGGTITNNNTNSSFTSGNISGTSSGTGSITTALPWANPSTASSGYSVDLANHSSGSLGRNF